MSSTANKLESIIEQFAELEPRERLEHGVWLIFRHVSVRFAVVRRAEKCA
ncbi:MAG TPA: hypothetical protein VHX65_02770 [Pirellulales bacterium]|jgi:hypothetical protein|nr:hypothetical protein [Pirellulales bacterium]